MRVFVQRDLIWAAPISIALMSLCSPASADLITINQGDTVRFDFSSSLAPPYFSTGFQFVTSSTNKIGPNESIAWQTYDLNNVLVNSNSLPTGALVFQGIGLNAGLPTTPGFYALVTAIIGSFELDTSTVLANFRVADDNLLCASSPNCEQVAGTTSVVPLPATLPLFASGLAGLGWLARRRKRAQAA